MNFSPEQTAFFSRLTSSSSSIQLQAAAGSGKTTTVVAGADMLPAWQTVMFLAFNKNIKEELEARLPKRCSVATFHAAGFRAWQAHTGKRLKPDGDKLAGILKDKLKGKDWELYFAYARRLTSLAKNMGMDTPLMENTFANWQSLSTHFQINLESEDAREERGIEICQRLLADSNALCDSVIDFDDMLYAPLRLNIKWPQSNVIFIDEAQDTNSVQIELLKRMRAANGRVIAVGDPSQAIYGFRGADSDAMNKMRDAFDMEVMPLSVSYRCSKAVVAEAQKFCK